MFSKAEKGKYETTVRNIANITAFNIFGSIYAFIFSLIYACLVLMINSIPILSSECTSYDTLKIVALIDPISTVTKM